MFQLDTNRPTKRLNRHGMRVACAVLALHLGFATGCDDDVFVEFREASANSLENGVKQILDGIVEGAFAAFTVGTNGATGGSASTNTNTGGATTGDDTTAGTGG